jgi:hypothetical protein
MLLETAAQIAANAPERELTDAELLKDYFPSFLNPDPNALVMTAWGILTAKEAAANERQAHIDRKRRAIQEAKEQAERSRVTAEERARQRQQFEAAAARGRFREAMHLGRRRISWRTRRFSRTRTKTGCKRPGRCA